MGLSFQSYVKVMFLVPVVHLLSSSLVDPLRGVLAHLVALITPGDLNCAFFCASGTEAIEVLALLPFLNF